MRTRRTIVALVVASAALLAVATRGSDQSEGEYSTEDASFETPAPEVAAPSNADLARREIAESLADPEHPLAAHWIERLLRSASADASVFTATVTSVDQTFVERHEGRRIPRRQVNLTVSDALSSSEESGATKQVLMAQALGEVTEGLSYLFVVVPFDGGARIESAIPLQGDGSVLMKGQLVEPSLLADAVVQMNGGSR